VVKVAFVKTIKDIPKEEYLAPGHRLCAGCGAAIAIRLALKALRGPTVIVNATGCIEVATTIYPYTSWRVPWIHVAFENAAAVASGVTEAFRIMEKKYGVKRPDVIAIGGDGGTFDIGLQALSGALERGHKMLYICYDNEAYMNTGIQRSGATPRGAATTTSPAGRVIPGKLERKKDLVEIAAAHGIPYAATASIAHPIDYINKVRKALEIDGPTFIHVLTPCVPGWRIDPSQTINIARLAVDTLVFPVYEVDNGKYKINVMVKKPKPLEEYIRPQGRFKHLLLPENKWLLDKLKEDVRAKWERLLKLASL